MDALSDLSAYIVDIAVPGLDFPPPGGPGGAGQAGQPTRTLRLVPIDRAGNPAVHGLLMDDAAREVCQATASFYARVGFVPPWIGYVTVADTRVVGSCSFKGRPVRGEVEIAYLTLPELEGRGLASTVAEALVRVAAAADPSIVVTAQTLPRSSASTRVLEKVGFHRRGLIEHPEDGWVWEWERRPAVR